MNCLVQSNGFQDEVNHSERHNCYLRVSCLLVEKSFNSERIYVFLYQPDWVLNVLIKVTSSRRKALVDNTQFSRIILLHCTMGIEEELQKLRCKYVCCQIFVLAERSSFVPWSITFLNRSISKQETNANKGNLVFCQIWNFPVCQ